MRRELCVGAALLAVPAHGAAGGQIQWRAAWEDTRGHFWFITTATVLAILPVVGNATVLTLVAEMLATGATCSVWLYRKFAAILRTEST